MLRLGNGYRHRLELLRGPLIAIKYSLILSNVSCGNHSPVWLNAFSPAKTSNHSIFFSPLYAFSTAASITREAAAQISGPIPSPSMKGITGLFGTFKYAVFYYNFTVSHECCLLIIINHRTAA